MAPFSRSTPLSKCVRRWTLLLLSRPKALLKLVAADSFVSNDLRGLCGAIEGSLSFSMIETLLQHQFCSRSSSVISQPRSEGLRLSMCDAHKFCSLVRHNSATLSVHDHFFSQTVAAALDDTRGLRLSFSVRSSRMIKGFLRLKAFAA